MMANNPAEPAAIAIARRDHTGDSMPTSVKVEVEENRVTTQRKRSTTDCHDGSPTEKHIKTAAEVTTHKVKPKS